MKPTNVVTVAQLSEFDELIDVRTPKEFLEDHIPNAINCPVLDDEQRAHVGTLYKQTSPFAAKKLGAALVGENISRHLQQRFIDRDKKWKPLIYCWRGGKRSGAMTHVLREIGWDAKQLEGGYKAYRREVSSQLQTLPQQYSYYVICGETGSGKSKLLQAIAKAGGQILDLETLACHRGSLLGSLPQQPQPSQKMFESKLWQALRQFNPRRPVYVEAESKKIGEVAIPDILLHEMWNSSCIRIDVPFEQRVLFLIDEYQHFLSDAELLEQRLNHLTAIYGIKKIEQWKSQVQNKEWTTLVTSLLNEHYDRAYGRSTTKHYPQLADALVFNTDRITDVPYAEMANQILHQTEKKFEQASPKENFAR